MQKPITRLLLNVGTVLPGENKNCDKNKEVKDETCLLQSPQCSANAMVYIQEYQNLTTLLKGIRQKIFCRLKVPVMYSPLEMEVVVRNKRRIQSQQTS